MIRFAGIEVSDLLENDNMQRYGTGSLGIIGDDHGCSHVNIVATLVVGLVQISLPR